MTSRSSNDERRRAGPELSAAIERLASDPERKSRPTLAEVRADLEKGGLQWSRNGELLHPQDRTSQLIELDELIALYGEEAPALDVVTTKARSSLSGDRDG
jgi:hypothetical protein